MKRTILNLMRYSTGCLSDAMDELSIPCCLHGIRARTDHAEFCGEAFTLQCASLDCTSSAQPEVSANIFDKLKEGQIIIINNNGIRDYAVWGDLLTASALSHSAAATIVNGMMRDVSEIQKLSYPVFSLGTTPVSAKGRCLIESVNTDITVCGIPVRPGDYIRGDRTGVVVIPKETASHILKIAFKIEQKEKKMHCLDPESSERGEIWKAHL